ncbi:GntR family transcriptional regulator [Robertmurraya andreesenii]|uniref:GntR family negative regulator for fad regulon and positive regulator of fabA n=1 Tax=Anoxybacillus andreesenii TaxID=1325932 RepID=A0ABT9V9A2_9BACL|nr:GntR family transcriptional regulator [Robertmurraya andreesenii]MDQ0157536.1 GntR family negative regulator for fad regulon and positive regulator of fabA [Robertmurraya andreesenii]
MKPRTSELIRKKIIKSILEGEYQIDEPLLPERELANLFHVGRPTVREALQSLESDGWITARKGMPAIVNNYWMQGNLMTIVNILQCYEDIPDIFIEYMLELRISLTPTYIMEAVRHAPVKVIALFADLENLQDHAEAYAVFDWELQLKLASLSPNPIYLFILNSFSDIYVPMAKKYFDVLDHRKASRHYYDELLAAVLKGDLLATEQLTKDMMKKSLQLWKKKCDEEESGK